VDRRPPAPAHAIFLPIRDAEFFGLIVLGLLEDTTMPETIKGVTYRISYQNNALH
jgi:hypothetical protein